MIDVLIETLDHSVLGYRYLHIYVGVLAFADDLLLNARSVQELNAMLELVRLWTVEYSLTLSINKTLALARQGLTEAVLYNG